MTHSSAPSLERVPGPRGIRALSRAIFDSDSPEQYVRTLPAQTVSMLIQHEGVSSSVDLVEVASVDQVRCALDFDLWDGDRFSDERFWEWLALPDGANAGPEDASSLRVLQKLLTTLDLKVVALVLSRYVQVHTFTEPTDMSPGPGFHTPDGGSTWLEITTEDPQRHFLLARFLALIFETNADLFYQLLAIPSVSTESQLEEESFQDAQRRLQAEGIPPLDQAHAICAPLTETAFRELLNARTPRPPISDIRVVEPLIALGHRLEPLSTILEQLTGEMRGGREGLEIELTHILNSALIRWRVPLAELERVQALLERVRGAINLGLELATSLDQRPPVELVEPLGLTPFFQAGLGALEKVARHARGVSVDEVRAIAEDAPQFSILACAREPFPQMPAFLGPDGRLREEDGKLLAGYKAIEHLAELRAIERIVGEIAASEVARES